MIGTVVSHYEILEQLGQGGMGIVYKARDTKLDRFVALKFLPPHLSADADANQRFIREAKAASALDHANICTVYEIGRTEDGRMFICMPFYDGETLKYRMQSDPLPAADAVKIVRQIVSGLQRAHDAGIVHRDIKPANVMVTAHGEVKILDFGIAKLEHGAAITQTGSTIGTVAYMSPEQASGSAADARSDLWSVGVMLYEMLTGVRPFEGDYDQAVIYGILNEDPAPLSERVPGWLAKVVARLLAKNPAERFQSAGELLTALDEPAGGQAPPRERRAFMLGKPVWIGAAVVILTLVGFWMLKSGAIEVHSGDTDEVSTVQNDVESPVLAVLPFSNLRRDPETDFLGYALADQVIGSLTYVKELSVRPASSVRQYKDADYDVRVAGEALGADYVMAGNYLRQGERMRLTVELVDVQSREMIWREPIELEYKDVFEMQDIVAERLLNRLEVQFSAAERNLMKADVPADPIAYEYYLRALPHEETREGNRLAIDLLEQAIALDSTFAPAWNELGVRLRIQGYWDMGGTTVAVRAKECFEKALELNPDLLSALSNVTMYYTDSGELDRAYEAVQRVLRINPSHAEGHFARGYVLRYAGQIQESEREMRHALGSDSTNPKFRSAAWTFITLKDYDSMRKAFRVSRLPGLAEAWDGEVLRRQGRIEEAQELFETAIQADQPDGIVGLWAQGVLYGMLGKFEKGLAAAKAWEQANILDGEGWYFLAGIYCFNGDSEKCLEVLDRAVDFGYYNYEMFDGDPFFDGVRDMPAYQTIYERARAQSRAFRERHF